MNHSLLPSVESLQSMPLVVVRTKFIEAPQNTNQFGFICKSEHFLNKTRAY